MSSLMCLYMASCTAPGNLPSSSLFKSDYLRGLVQNTQGACHLSPVRHHAAAVHKPFRRKVPVCFHDAAHIQSARFRRHCQHYEKKIIINEHAFIHTYFSTRIIVQQSAEKLQTCVCPSVPVAHADEDVFLELCPPDLPALV